MVKIFLIDYLSLLILHLHQNHNQEFDKSEYYYSEFVQESKHLIVFKKYVYQKFIHTVCFI